MFSNRETLVAIACIAGFLTIAPAAAEDPISRGEIEATFDAGFTGGSVIRLIVDEPAELVSAPVTGRGGRISLFSDFRTYSVLDWHLISSVIGTTRAYPEAAAALNSLEIVFTLDGLPFSQTRKPIKRAPSLFNTPDFDASWIFQEGKIFAPGELTIGAHSLDFVAKIGEFVQFERSVTFFIE